MSFCEFKLSEECDLVTIAGIKKDGLYEAYNILTEREFDPWTVCRCEVFRNSCDLTLLIPTGRLCDLLDAVKEIKKTTPHLTTMIRTGVVKIDVICHENKALLNDLLNNENFPKPQLICASQDKIQLILESYDAPTAIGIISFNR